MFDFDEAISGGAGYQPIRTFQAAGPVASSNETTGPIAPLDAFAGVGPVPVETKLSWGAVAVQKHGKEFKARVIEIAGRLSCDPNHLMAIMAFELANSFAPDKANAAGSGAVGLIQFMPKTAQGLGTSTAKLKEMSAIDQLDFVEKYFRSIAGSRPLPSLSDAYMAVLLPIAVGKLDSHILFTKPSKAYDQNSGLDINKNGSITKAEATSKVHGRLVLGLKEGRIG